MEKNKEKVKLNNELMDRISGGSGDVSIPCPGCLQFFPYNTDKEIWDFREHYNICRGEG